MFGPIAAIFRFDDFLATYKFIDPTDMSSNST